MLLNHLKILRMRKNINQFIIWQKVESRERFPLHFHVILQTFLDFIKNLIICFELIKSLRILLDNTNALWHFLSSLHQSFARVCKAEVWSHCWSVRRACWMGSHAQVTRTNRELYKSRSLAQIEKCTQWQSEPPQRHMQKSRSAHEHQWHVDGEGEGKWDPE